MGTTTLSARTRSSKKFKALLDIGFTEAQAAQIIAPATEVKSKTKPKNDSPRDILAKAGWDDATIEAILAKGAPEPAKPLTSKEQGELLVAERELTFTRGRVYLNARMIESAVRVGKTGKPEIINSGLADRDHHVTAVLIYRTDGTDVAVQNLH